MCSLQISNIHFRMCNKYKGGKRGKKGHKKIKAKTQPVICNKMCATGAQGQDYNLVSEASTNPFTNQAKLLKQPGLKLTYCHEK